MIKVQAVGFDLPNDFPGKSYDAANAASWALIGDPQGPRGALVPHITGSLNAVAYRFRALHDYSAEFTKALAKTPEDHESIYQAGNALYGYFATAYSAVDCCAYWLYSLGAAKWPASFALLQQPTNERNITIRSAVKSYESVSAGTTVPRLLKSAVDSVEYKRIRDVRNVLGHRAHPGRLISLSISFGGPPSATPDPPATMNIHGQTLALAPATLEPFRNWLAKTLHKLLKAGAALA